jgi:hypothetical protein
MNNEKEGFEKQGRNSALSVSSVFALIEQGKECQTGLGKALHKIYMGRLWKDAKYKSFVKLAYDEFGLGSTQAYKHVAVEGVRVNLGSASDGLSINVLHQLSAIQEAEDQRKALEILSETTNKPNPTEKEAMLFIPIFRVAVASGIDPNEIPSGVLKQASALNAKTLKNVEEQIIKKKQDDDSLSVEEINHIILDELIKDASGATGAFEPNDPQEQDDETTSPELDQEMFNNIINGNKDDPTSSPTTHNNGDEKEEPDYEDFSEEYSGMGYDEEDDLGANDDEKIEIDFDDDEGDEEIEFDFDYDEDDKETGVDRKTQTTPDKAVNAFFDRIDELDGDGQALVVKKILRWFCGDVTDTESTIHYLKRRMEKNIEAGKWLEPTEE